MLKEKAVSLILNSLDFNRELENKTGFQVQLDEAVNTQVGSSAFSRGDGSAGSSATKIVIKRRVSVLDKSLDLSYGNTISGVTQQTVGAEVFLSPNVSVQGVYDLPETTTTRPASLGLDLKFQTRFK